MQAIYKKRVRTGQTLSGQVVIATQEIPLNIHYEAQSAKDGHVSTAEPYELGANIENIIYLNGEPCDLATLKLIIEEV